MAYKDKAKKAEYDKARNQRPEVIARQRAIDASPEKKEYQRLRVLHPEVKARRMAGRDGQAHNALARAWKKTPQGRTRVLVDKQRRRARQAEVLSTLTADQWERMKAAFGDACAYCGRPSSEVGALQMDHIMPLSRYGDFTPANIVPACRSCNASKGDRTPDEAGMIISTPFVYVVA